MINILLNGEQTCLQPNMTVSDLLEKMGLQDKRLAVEINLDIIPRSEYQSTRLNQDDKVEIVQAIGGGQHRIKALKPTQ